MLGWLSGSERKQWIGYAVALGAVGLVSVVIGVVAGRNTVANLSILYLLAVLLAAVAFGSGPAVAASVAAFLTFNWFFVEPLHTLTVHDPAEVVALLLFLLTATITGQLAAGQRRRAREAEQREREAVVLYDVVRLLGEPDLEQALRAVADRLRAELRLAAVALELDHDQQGQTRVAVGEEEALHALQAMHPGPARLLGEGRPPTADERGGPGRWVRVVRSRPPGWQKSVQEDRLRVVPVRTQDRRVGSLLLASQAGAPAFSAVDDRLLSAVAAQLGLAAERARLRAEATEAEILRRTDELKTALLNAVSHDLRTPLATILASAGSLRQRDVAWTDDEREAFASAIEEEARRLNRLVQHLLDLSRIEGGSLRPDKSWYDLSALIDDVLGRLRPVTQRHHVVVDVPDDLPPIPLDYVAVDQVLSNLVENAAKYAPPGSEIVLTARLGDGEVTVQVADRGPGIPPAALSHLFEPFYRAPGPGHGAAGVGLGLAVAKGLIVAHGGRMQAENGPHGGARFTFTLPLGELGPRDFRSDHAA